MMKTLEALEIPTSIPATDQEILSYLRRSRQIADISAATEQEILVINVCQHLNITVSEEELQAAGDSFRQEYKLLGTSETLAWLAQQKISVEEWSEGIRLSLLIQKLKEYLFGEAVDSHYINNRDDYKRVALSQILVPDLVEATKIAQTLREDKASFCAFALEYSCGSQSKKNGGFVGIKFLVELPPEIAKVVTDALEGEIVGPIQTHRGFHILKIEKWFSAELNQAREQILETLFQTWLQEKEVKSSTI